MKKPSILLIIISSAGIVIGETLSLVNSTFAAQKIVGVSFIGLGAGAIMLGMHMLKNKSNDNNFE